MKGSSHKIVTVGAFNLLHSQRLLPNWVGNRMGIHKFMSIAANSAAQTDYFTDMEFVDVDFKRDDPHKSSRLTADDIPHFEAIGEQFTAFNHFIDIKKGPGIFDDYDGYSYKKGSASKDEFMPATKNSLTGKWFPGFTDRVIKKLGFGLDEAINTYLRDEYVHRPGQKWYRNCSPAIPRYSRYKQKGKYKSVIKEAKDRFPSVTYSVRTVKVKGGGIPKSVFMPVDNLGLYWFNKYLKSRTRTPSDLGPVMHAIQDASIPHHAAGYCGNWHQQYEQKLKGKIRAWFRNNAFKNESIALFNKWKSNRKKAPKRLTANDWKLTPSRNWPIDLLITWLALNAYRSYSKTYKHFKRNAFNVRDAKELTKKATAMCMLMFVKTRKTTRVPARPGNPS